MINARATLIRGSGVCHYVLKAIEASSTSSSLLIDVKDVKGPTNEGGFCENSGRKSVGLAWHILKWPGFCFVARWVKH